MRTQHVQLKHGINIGEQVYKDVVLREPCVADYMEAEKDAPVYRQYGFKVALIAQVIDKVDGYDGPVTFSMLKDMKPTDIGMMAEVLDKLEEDEGNA